MAKQFTKKKNGSSKKSTTTVRTYDISTNSLFQVPNDAIEGYQERIETGIEWSLLEEAARHHKKRVQQDDIPTRTFSVALKTKLEKSILSGLLNEHSKLSLKQYLETTLLTIWDINNLGKEAEKHCFESNNSLTDNIEQLLRRVVKHGHRKYLYAELKNIPLLRINNAKLTNLDESLLDYEHLENIILCGNYIKEIEVQYLPKNLKMLELKANGIKKTLNYNKLPRGLFYLGLARNLLCDESVTGFFTLPHNLCILDLADNDIYDLCHVLDALASVTTLTSLTLAGNPCSVTVGYALATLKALPKLIWLDNREILETDRKQPVTKKDLSHQTIEANLDDLRAAYFVFRVIRIMSAPVPPKLEKGQIGTFHVELEIPLLDSKRRNFLMFRKNTSLVEVLPEPENGWPEAEPSTLEIDTFNFNRNRRMTRMIDMRILGPDDDSHPSIIYKSLERRTSREILNYKILKSNKVQWNVIMTFQDPTFKISCPDLTALRDTFRSIITTRLVYSLTQVSKPPKDKSQPYKPPPEYSVVLATIRSKLQRPDWSQKWQYFHWDNSMKTDDAIFWGDGDLDVLHYAAPQTKMQRDKKKEKLEAPHEPLTKQRIPPRLTCHFSFGIETLLHNNTIPG